MINKEKLIANWDTLKDETKTKILDLADKEIKEDYFVPKVGEVYYIYGYDTSLEVLVKKWGDYSFFDKYFLELGNVFRTLEEAEFAGKCDYFTKLFETYVNRHTKKLDWNDKNQDKFYVFYYFNGTAIKFSADFICKGQGTVYASSEQILKDAIADIGEENFLKYVLKVGE